MRTTSCGEDDPGSQPKGLPAASSQTLTIKDDPSGLAGGPTGKALGSGSKSKVPAPSKSTLSGVIVIEGGAATVTLDGANAAADAIKTNSTTSLTPVIAPLIKRMLADPRSGGKLLCGPMMPESWPSGLHDILRRSSRMHDKQAISGIPSRESLSETPAARHHVIFGGLESCGSALAPIAELRGHLKTYVRRSNVG